MTTRLNPYLSFNGNARDALEFYHRVLGGQLDMTTFGEFGLGGPDDASRLMHGQITTPDDLMLMAADTPPGEDPAGPQSTISLSGTDESQLRGFWVGLSEGATIHSPLEKAPWGDVFGHLVDRFGVPWMVNIAEA